MNYYCKKADKSCKGSTTQTPRYINVQVRAMDAYDGSRETRRRSNDPSNNRNIKDNETAGVGFEEEEKSATGWYSVQGVETRTRQIMRDES